MIENGTWVLWERDGYSVLLEIDQYTGFLYFWSEESGIASHLWLFNQPGKYGEDKAPQMPADHINQDAYFIPQSNAEVSVQECRQRPGFEVLVKGERIGFLPRSGRGTLIFVSKSCDLAMTILPKVN
ncbi:MAG: hypothetical protein MK098_13580 [Marinovum sp.]|nr:hypothetical protein [Marinovum sp.]